MSNYPDDIREYDNDPRSPFYSEGPMCPDCDEPMKCDSQDELGYPELYCTNCLDDDDEEE